MSQDDRRDYSLIPNTAKLLVIAPAETKNILAGKLKALRTTAEALPETYDVRSKFNILQPYQQGGCGSCWAVSSASVFTDRLIVSRGAYNIEIDPLQFTRCVYIGVDCVETGICNRGETDCLAMCKDGCKGGFPESVGKYLERVGGAEPINGCKSYRTYSYKCNSGPYCLNSILPKCADAGQNCVKKYKAKVGSTRALVVYYSREDRYDSGDVDRFDISKRPANPFQTLISIKSDILYKGPVVGAFIVYEDFCHFYKNTLQSRTNGIYIKGSYDDLLVDKSGERISNTDLGGHAIEIVGWGKGDGGRKPDGSNYGIVPYWILKNSWGTDWCEGGYVKFAMYPYNRECAIDVPTVYFYNGKPMVYEDGEYNLFGGCTAFDVDPDSIALYGKGNVDNGTGPKPGTQISTTPLESITATNDTKKQTIIVTVVVVVVLLGLGGSAYYWREKLGVGKKKR